MADTRFRQVAHDLIDALKMANGHACDDAEIRDIVTGGITDDRDVLMDELRYQSECGRTNDPVARRTFAKIVAMGDYERAAVCAFATMIIRERARRVRAREG